MSDENEDEGPEVEAILAQLERLDYLYDAMKPTWDKIQANLQKTHVP